MYRIHEHYRSHLFTLLLVLLIGACSSGEDGGPAAPTGGANFDAVITLGGEPEVPTPRNEVLEEQSYTDLSNGETFICTRQRVSLVETPEKFPLFDPNSAVIWPGALIQGQSLNQATPDPIPIGNRGPGAIFIPVLNGASADIRRELPAVTAGYVNTIANEIIADLQGQPLAAKFSFTSERVHSKEHMSAKLGIGFGSLVADARVELSFTTDQDYNRYVVKLQQAFYTINLETGYGTRVDEVFDGTVTAEELARFVQPGNPPCFINSVTYGRVFYLLIESTSSAREMEAKVSASFKGAVNGDASAEGGYVSSLENLRVKAFAVGGEAGSALDAVNGGFDELRTFLTEGGAITTGTPLSYTAYSLARPDQQVKVGIALEYDAVDCLSIGESFDKPVFAFNASQATVDGSGNVSRLNNLFSEDAAQDAVPQAGKSFGARQVGSGLGSNPALRFGASSGSRGNGFRVQGNELAETDYTLIVVARTLDESMNYPTHFLWGRDEVESRNLQAGYRLPGQVTMTHEGPTLNAATGLTNTGWQIYTFRFSQTDGMSVYVNGLTSPIASDATQTSPLLTYDGANLGSSNGEGLDILEVRAWGQALNDAQRKYVIEDLQARYSL